MMSEISFPIKAKSPMPNKQRILVRKEGKKHNYAVLIGTWNTMTVIYSGQKKDCLRIKVAFMSTGDFIDETPKCATL